MWIKNFAHIINIYSIYNIYNKQHYFVNNVFYYK
jgi:hypothetical protein